jgi:ubiquinone/menaquinone biosynthesis C-methylase UbiE
MKVRESGMPEQDIWDAFFDVELILDKLQLDLAISDVAEFGGGYGTFTLPAARRISGSLHAFDLETGMLAAATRSAADAGVDNINFQFRDFVADGTGLPDESVDYAMLFNILHLEDPQVLLKEVYRVLRPGGLLGVIHWNYNDQTPRGPPMDVRPRPGQCYEWSVEAGFTPASEILDFPPYHYGFVAQR